MPIEIKDPLVSIYLEKNEFNSFPRYGKTDAEEKGTNYSKSLNQSFLNYLRSKSIFLKIEFCELESQEYKIKLVLEKYNLSYYFPVHPMISGMFLAGIPILFATQEYNISIHIEVYRGLDKIIDYPYKEEFEVCILNKRVPDGAYRYFENFQSRQGAVGDIYLDAIYDTLIEKLYLDAKEWK